VEATELEHVKTLENKIEVLNLELQVAVAGSECWKRKVQQTDYF
jgi:hypothetical protein